RRALVDLERRLTVRLGGDVARDVVCAGRTGERRSGGTGRGRRGQLDPVAAFDRVGRERHAFGLDRHGGGRGGRGRRRRGCGRRGGRGRRGWRRCRGGRRCRRRRGGRDLRKGELVHAREGAGIRAADQLDAVALVDRHVADGERGEAVALRIGVLAKQRRALVDLQGR